VRLKVDQLATVSCVTWFKPYCRWSICDRPLFSTFSHITVSWRNWSTHRPCGQPGRRFQSALHGNLLTFSFKAWWAGAEAGSLATWQKTEDRRLQMRSADRWQSGTEGDVRVPNSILPPDPS